MPAHIKELLPPAAVIVYIKTLKGPRLHFLYEILTWIA